MTHSIRSELLRGLFALAVVMLLAVPAVAAGKFWTDPKTGDTWTTDPQVCGPRAGFEGESWVAIQTWTAARTGNVWTTDPRATGPRVDGWGCSWVEILVWVDPAIGAIWTTDPNAVGPTWAGYGHTWTNISAPLSRPADPVILKGEDLPMFKGIAPESLVAFRYEGGWVQIPIQVDERDVRSYGEIYDFLDHWSLVGDPVGTPGRVGPIYSFLEEFYTDPGTFMGPDTDPMLDDNDEVVFMARDTGNIATGIADPPGVIAGSRAEVRVSDPLDGTTGYVYLFQSAGGLDPSAGQSYVDYQFNLQSGDYLATFRLLGINLELSTVSSQYYERSFTSRLRSEVLRITAPGASGVDILDTALPCPGITEELEGAFVANKSGPVRGIRSHLGRGSGPAIQRVHFFYEQREDMALHWRVHAVSGKVSELVDHAPAAIGMTYFNNNNLAGVIVDGVPDSVTPGILQWELITGFQGSLVTIQDIVSSSPIWQRCRNRTPSNPEGDCELVIPPVSSYYLDGVFSDPLCLGDVAIGTSGQTLAWAPDTDPRTSSFAVAFVSSRYYGPPGWSVADAEQLRLFSENPLVTTVPNN